MKIARRKWRMFGEFSTLIPNYATTIHKKCLFTSSNDTTSQLFFCKYPAKIGLRCCKVEVQFAQRIASSTKKLSVFFHRDAI